MLLNKEADLEHANSVSTYTFLSHQARTSYLTHHILHQSIFLLFTSHSFSFKIFVVSVSLYRTAYVILYVTIFAWLTYVTWLDVSVQHGHTALLEATKCGHVTVARLLLNRGAQLHHVNKVTTTHPFHYSLIHLMLYYVMIFYETRWDEIG